MHLLLLINTGTYGMVANLSALGLVSPLPMVTNNFLIPNAVSYFGPNVNSDFLLPWIIFKGVLNTN